MSAVWIGFLGSIIGGFIALLGVKITIDSYKNQEAEKAKLEKEQNIALLYWNIKSHKERINALYNNINNNQPLTLIKSYNDYDYQFYFNKITYIQDILSPENITTLILFYHGLADIEEHRIKNDYNVYKNVIEGYVRTMCGEDVFGKGHDIDDILNKLKPYVGKMI